MNIILHCDEYSPHWGPCTVRMKVFSDTFQSVGDNVTVLSSKTNLDGAADGESNAIYCPAIKMKKKSTLHRLENNLSFAISSFFKSGKTGKADVVITTSPPVLSSRIGRMIAIRKKAKLVYDVRDIWPDVAIEMGSFSENSIYSQIFGVMVNSLLKHADIITTVSKGKLEKLQNKLPNDQRNKVWLVENGLDENFLNQNDDKSVIEKYALDKKFTCVYVGNIGLAQGLGHLLDLAECVDKDQYQFLLFGNGAEKEKLEASAHERGLYNVLFCGTVNAGTVYSILKHSSMTYIPLVNANLKDSIPTKTYEALGVGCPILMVAEGDAPELLKECKLGISLTPKNIDELPNAFNKFCKDYDNICSNREFARKIVLEKHSRQRIALDFERRLQKFINKGMPNEN